MSRVDYLNLIPSQQNVRSGEPLNVLLMAVNIGKQPQRHTFHLFAQAAGCDWVDVAQKAYELAPKEHLHAYLQVPGEVFCAKFWGLEELDELTLFAADAPPKQIKKGNNCAKLIFVLP